MGADIVHLVGFIGLCGDQRRLGQHPHLQRQQIAKNARERHHHVDARAAQHLERDEVRAGEAAKGVEPRLGPHQCQSLRHGRAVRFDIVRPPEHEGHRTRQALVGFQQACRLTRAIAAGEFGGHAERIESMDIAPRGQDIGRADQVAAGHGRGKVPAKRPQQRGNLRLLL